MSPVRRERVLVLAKTYPSPSAKDVETSCVAGINQDGQCVAYIPDHLA